MEIMILVVVIKTDIQKEVRLLLNNVGENNTFYIQMIK